MINVRWLQALRAVVGAGTVTGAAERLHLTQPAVSRMLAHLEQELGFALFARRGGRLTITPEGEAFYVEVEAALAGLDGIEQVGRHIRSGSGAHLRLFAFSPLASDLVPEALARFRRDYPTVNVSLEIRSRRDITQWVAGRQFDLGLLLLPVDNLGAHTRPFASAPAFVVVPEMHPLANAAAIRLTDLAGERLIMLPAASLLRRLIDGKFAEVGSTPQVVIETSTMLSACQLVARGLGVTVVDAFTVRTLSSLACVARPLSPELLITFGFALSHWPAAPMIGQLMATIEAAAEDLLDGTPGARTP